MKIKSIVVTSGLAIAAIATQLHAGTPLTFSTFITQSQLTALYGTSYPIGLTYAGNKFVGSAGYDHGSPQLYQSNLTGTSITTFGAPVPNVGGELVVGASFNGSAFGSNDIYAGSGGGPGIWKFSNDGSTQSFFANVTSGAVRAIAFDPYGLYGDDMIVTTTSGDVDKITSAGSVSLLANVGEDTEGIGFAPQTFDGYGKGTLFTTSEAGVVHEISPTGVVQNPFNIPSAETISFVPLDLGSSGNPVEGFYAVNYPNNIEFAGPSQFSSYLGDAIVTSEVGGQLWDISGATGAITQIGQINQPEDSIFVTADTIRIVNGSVPDGGQTVLMLLGGVALVAAMARSKMAQAGFARGQM